jgi:hypothetical protein
MKALTAASSNASEACAGGSRAQPAQCYADTKIEIEKARALRETMLDASTPPRFAKANRDFIHGLDVLIEGLSKRNEGLAIHSANEYKAGEYVIEQGLALQRSALAEYPANSHIAP